MPPADTPDFDSMSPEEVMAWLETLAKRQGANEGFTTAADVEIPEIDPDSVVIDEPGYVPYGETAPPKPTAAPQRPPVQAAPPPAPPAPEPPPTRPTPLPLEDEEQETRPAPAAAQVQGLAWLESLAADQGSDFPQIDLSALSLETAAPPPAAPQPAANPLDWLESLAEGQGIGAAPEPPVPAPPPAAEEPDLSGIEDPMAAGIDPMLWLESLARRQGARAEELVTPADMDIPAPKAPPPPPAAQEPAPIARPGAIDPAAWLESLASEAGFEETEPEEEAMTDAEIQQALQTGRNIPPDQMAAFLDRQLARQIEAGELSAQALDEEEEAEIYDPDAPAVPADLPDWLLEQVDSAPPPIEQPERPPLIDEIVEPPTIQDLPDWLREDLAEETVPELEDIFAAEEEQAAAAFAEAGIDIDSFASSDPWVQAFEEEQQMPPIDSGILPDWYQRNINDPARLAAVERLEMGVEEPEPEAAPEAALPQEMHLPAGEPEAEIPEWAGPAEPAAIASWLSDTSISDEIPDWLREAEADIAPTEIPDWLRDTVETDETEAPAPVIMPPAAQVPAPAPVHVPAAPPAPVPQAVPAASFDVATILQNARASASAGDLSTSLSEYETIIRANTALDAVVGDLTQLAQQNQDNPTVYRVLGDSLMRQGKLQAALDTYRRALNQL